MNEKAQSTNPFQPFEQSQVWLHATESQKAVLDALNPQDYYLAMENIEKLVTDGLSYRQATLITVGR